MHPGGSPLPDLPVHLVRCPWSGEAWGPGSDEEEALLPAGIAGDRLKMFHLHHWGKPGKHRLGPFVHFPLRRAKAGTQGQARHFTMPNAHTRVWPPRLRADREAAPGLGWWETVSPKGVDLEAQMCMLRLPQGRRCWPGARGTLLGEVVCGHGQAVLPASAVGNLSPPATQARSLEA